MNDLRFDLPDKHDEQTIVEAIIKDFALKSEAPISQKLTYFDTFDWRLYNKSLVLRGSGDELFLSELGSGDIGQRINITAPPVFIQDFPHGDIKNQLASIIEMRALLELAQVQSQVTPYRVLNSDEKTVAWLYFEKVTPIPCQDTGTMAQQVLVKPVRGYSEFKAVARHLQQLGCAPTDKDIYFLALESVGRTAGDYSSKLNVQLQPQMRSEVATKLLLRAMLTVMRQNEAHVIEDVDTEFLHDFRVAVRRTRSVLSQVKNVFPQETTNRYKQDFAYIGKLSNDLRDLDVYLLAEDHYRAMIPDVLRNDINPLFDYLKQKRGDALKTVINGITSEQYATILQDWEAFLNQPVPDTPSAANAAVPIITLARSRIYRHYRRIVNAGKEILTNTEDEKLHDLRIECKKLRYLMEFFASLFPATDIAKLTRQLKKLQDNLGDFNDFCVQEEYLMNIAGELPLTNQQSRKTLLAVGSLVDTLHQQRLTVKNEFAQTFNTFASQSNQKLFKKLFAPDKKASKP